MDEFQDTNERQRELVELLNVGVGDCFIVGDAKQSIYRFRGAEVEVFRSARHQIGDHGFACSLALLPSYPSAPAGRAQQPAGRHHGRRRDRW